VTVRRARITPHPRIKRFPGEMEKNQMLNVDWLKQFIIKHGSAEIKYTFTHAV
jgi:hypothetical protein